MKALHRGVEREFKTDPKETHWGKRKLKAGPIAGGRVIRSKFTACPQARFSGSASSRMGLLRTRSQARKSRR